MSALHCNVPTFQRRFYCRAELPDEEVKSRIRKVRNLVRYWDKLIPADQKSFNGAKVLWDSLEDIPKDRRPDLLPYLNSLDIKRIWTISADRYISTPYSTSPVPEILDECKSPVKFSGRSATPVVWFGVGSRCTRLFFTEEETYETFGRATYPLDVLLRAVYPLYFRVNGKSGRIPATGEIYDFSLEYIQRAELTKGMVPDGWPAPRNPVFPFHGRLIEYLRPIGPECFVGTGWRAPRPQYNDLGRPFLTFILIRS